VIGTENGEAYGADQASSFAGVNAPRSRY